MSHHDAELRLTWGILLAEDALTELDRGPENHATAVALGDARRWQEARRAVDTGCGGARQGGLGWEEI